MFSYTKFLSWESSSFPGYQWPPIVGNAFLGIAQLSCRSLVRPYITMSCELNGHSLIFKNLISRNLISSVMGMEERRRLMLKASVNIIYDGGGQIHSYLAIFRRKEEDNPDIS